MRSLRSRLILSHILPLVILIPAIGFGLIFLIRTQILLANISSELTHQAVLVAAMARDYYEIWYDPGRAEAFVNTISPSLMANITLIDSDGRILVSSDPQDANQVGEVYASPLLQKAYQSPNIQVEYSKSQPSEISNVLVPVIHPMRGIVGFVRLSNPFTTIEADFQRLSQVILIVLGAGLLAGLVIGLILAISLERPLKRTTQAVYQLANGEQLAPLPESGPEEIKYLLRAFNTLSLQLRSLEVSRRQLLANLVHELGRPLGALQSAVQALLGGADQDPGLRKELLSGMGDELARLRNLLTDLSHLHDQVVGSLELNCQPLHMEEWLPRVLAPWREAALDKQQDFSFEIEPGLPALEIDPDRFGQAIGNLVSNAIRYTPSGGRVRIDIHGDGGEVRFQVTDTGPGISADEQERIFTPFYRGRSARRFSDGMGLGLSIARDLVTAHGGRLTLVSTPGQGSRFTIHLPVEGEDPLADRVYPS